MKKLTIAVGIFLGVLIAVVIFKERVSQWIEWCLQRGFSSFTMFQ
jgi:hypothetical protein